MYWLVVWVNKGELQQEAFNDKMKAFDHAVKKNGWVIHAINLSIHPDENTEYVVWKSKKNASSIVDEIIKDN